MPVAVQVLAVVAASAQGVEPIEDQFQVNTYTTEEQTNPAVAMDADGGYIVVWTTEVSPGPDLSGSSIRGQLFSSDSTPVGDEFQVNSFATDFQVSPSVAMRPTGEFVAVWGSSASEGGDPFYSVQGQRFAADGRPEGYEFQVNTLTDNVQESPSVAVARTGEFLVVWQSVGSYGPDDDGRSIQAQLFAATGAPVGNQLQVNSYSGADQADPEVAVGPAGEYVVTWYNTDGSAGDPSGRSVQGQQISATGQLIGGELQVNSYTDGDQYNPSVAVGPGGEFVVVWSGYGSFGSDTDYAILGQRFDADGLAVGSEFQVNTYIDAYQIRPWVDTTDDGTFLVAWTSGEYDGTGPDGDAWAIAGQAYAADGTPAGDELVVNNVATGRQQTPAVGAAPDQRYVVTWQSESSPGDDTSESVQARRFVGDRHGLIFADGFESGDLSVWTP